MELKQLIYFTHVADLGSFTHASVVLGIGQPVLSRQIRLLEVELRQNLLRRNGRGVTTTEAGQLLLEHCRGILHQVERVKEELGRVRGALAGRVVVGLPPSIARMMTVRLVREFRQRLPDATLSISEGLSVSMLEWLKAGRLDIALLYNPAPSADFDTTPLAAENLYLVGSRICSENEEPITLEAVSALALVIPNRPHAIRMLLETQMASIGRKPLIGMEIDGVPAILELVADGMGYGVLSKHAVSTCSNPKAYTLRPIVEPALVSRLCMATASGRATTLTQSAILELIKVVIYELFGRPEDTAITF